MQNYCNLEYIIIDGGSTDESVDIIRQYEPRIAWWVSEPDTGQSNAINKGLTRATGDVFAWLNSDDYLMPGALHAVAQMYMQNPDAGAYVGAGEFVNEKGRVLLRKEPPVITLESLYDWLATFHFMQPSCFVARDTWNAVGGLDESVHIAMDVDLWLKIARRRPFMRTDKLISRSLVHAGAKTAAYRYFAEIDTAFVIMHHGGEQQARKAIEKIAAKLAWYESPFSYLFSTRLFHNLLPVVKRLLAYDKKLNSLYPRWLRK